MASYPTIPNNFVSRTLIQSTKFNENNVYINNIFSSGDYRYNPNEIYVNGSLFCSTGKIVTASSGVFDGYLRTGEVFIGSEVSIQNSSQGIIEKDIDVSDYGNNIRMIIGKRIGGISIAPASISFINNFNSGNANWIRFYVAENSGGSEGLAVEIYHNGNVGIGTGLTPPSEKLHVAGKGLFTDTMSTQSDIYAEGAIGNNSYFYLKDGLTPPSTVSGRAFTYIDSADGDYKIKFGNGTVKVLATNP